MTATLHAKKQTHPVIIHPIQGKPLGQRICASDQPLLCTIADSRHLVQHPGFIYLLVGRASWCCRAFSLVSSFQHRRTFVSCRSEVMPTIPKYLLMYHGLSWLRLHNDFFASCPNVFHLLLVLSLELALMAEQNKPLPDCSLAWAQANHRLWPPFSLFSVIPKWQR